MLISDLKDKLQNEGGAALLLTMILMIVFSLLTVSMFEMLKASTQITGNHRQDLKAICITDAGAEDAINQLRIDPTLGDGADLALASVDFAGGAYTVTIKDVAVSNPIFHREKDIIATGTFRNITRVLKVHVGIFKVSGKFTPVYAVATSSWKLT